MIDRKQKEASRLNKHLILIEKDIQKLESEQAELIIKNKEAQYVLSIPGVGPAFTASFMAYIGNGERFSSSSQVSNYAGLVPKVDQSGESAYYGRIRKGGCLAIKRVAIPAAWALTRSSHGGSLNMKYLIPSKRRGKKVAIVMLARRMVELAYFLVKVKKYYDNGELVDINPKLKRLKNKIIIKQRVA